jgi:predicted permease
MRWLDVIRLRARSVFRRERLDADLDRELRAHLDHQIDENIARGMSPAEARRAAVSTFGGVEKVREESRDARGMAVLDNLLRDLRYTLRALLREPMLLVAATLSIALGAAGNIAVFSLARALVFAPPDVRDPATLVTMQVSHGSHASYQRWRDLEASGGLAHIAGYSIEQNINWLDDGAAVSVTPMLVTANFFEVTGVPIALGRGFSSAEARAELDPHVAVISHEFWQRNLRGDSAILGRSLTLNGASYTVLGVLPPRVRSVMGFSIAPNIYVPLNRSLVPSMTNEKAAVVQLIGRLEPAQTVAAGRAAVDAIDRRLARLQGDTLYGGVQEFARVGSFASTKMFRVVGGFLTLLGLVSLFVLLIGCANVAGLLIARGTRRRQEIAIRLAIGGSRARLVQQLLIEGFWLALIGTVAGVALSVLVMRFVNSLALPIPVPVSFHLEPDRVVLLGAGGIIVLTMLLCALLPALHATRLSLTPALKREEPFYATRRFTARGVLMIGQVTVSTVLLVTALLFVRNLTAAHLTNPGFEIEHAVVAELGFVRGPIANDNVTLLEEAIARVKAMPGVSSAAYTGHMPLTAHAGSSNGLTARIGSSGEPQHVEFSRAIVGPGLFTTLGIRVVAGREFEKTDAPRTPAVAIINEEFVRKYFRGENPIGQPLRLDDAKPLVVVGVVADIKQRTLGEDRRPAIYLPMRQADMNPEVAYVLARTAGDPTPLVMPIRAVLGALDKSVAWSVDPIDSVLQFALLPSRLGAAILGSLGMLGLLLAAFGLYAIVAYNVSRRVAEIAIRTALGASRGAVLRLVMRDASIHVGVGLVLGLGISALVTSPLAAFLAEGLSPTDPLSFAGTAIVFLAVSAVASWLPARSAMRVSPVVAMRLD